MLQPVWPRLRRQVLLAALLVPLAGPLIAADLSGRWEGELRIPAAPLPIVLDLAASPTGGWVGSVTLPGRGVKGASLEALQVIADSVGASLDPAFGGAGSTPTRLDLKLQADGSLALHPNQGSGVLSSLAFADYLAVLAPGQVVQPGDPLDLLSLTELTSLP